MAFKFLRPLNADDIFISYTRRDASTYAAGLADELTKRGFSCFIDKLGTDPDAELPDSLKRKIRSCSMLVVVGTRRAATRRTVKEEVAEFVAAGRTSVVPIDFGDTVYGADWYEPIEGIAPESELNPNALDDGDPSPSVLSRIEKQFNYRRRDERLRRITRRAIIVLVLLVIAIAVAAGVAWRQLERARDASAQAERATLDAQAALTQATTTQAEALLARTDAAVASAEAVKQKGIADKATQTATEKTRLADEAATRAKESEGRANAAQALADREQTRAERQAAIADIRAGANRSQAYLRQRPEDVSGSLSLALDALKTTERISVRNADADAAVRESLALLPLRHSLVHVEVPTDIAFSPDGLNYATVDSANSKTLRVYATGDKDADKVTPLMERPCDCSAVTLASGLTRAAVVLSDGRGFKLFDLKDDSRSRVFESFKGAHDEKINSAEKLALSPNGRYLALYADEGEGEGRHSELLVLDTESDDAAHTGDARDIAPGLSEALNMFIWDISFGSTGNLAIVGRQLDKSGARAVIWRLNTDAAGAGAQSKLTANSFKDYEVIPQEKDVDAVAPGADETYFATDKDVWKRPAWLSMFDTVARIPSTTDDSLSTVQRMAFRPGGRSLVLARRIMHQGYEGNTMDEVVEVWDTEGYTSQAEVFHTAEVVSAGFKPGGRLVAAVTEYDSKNVTGGPTGENREHRLRIYQADTGTEVASAEPTPEDRAVFYVGPDAAQILTLSGNTVKVWDVWAKDEPKRNRVASYEGALDSLESVALSPGGSFLALAGSASDGPNIITRVIIYHSDGRAYTESKRFSLGPDEVRWGGGLALSADGRRLVVLYKGDENTVRVYDDGVENTALRERLDGLSSVWAVALSANGRYIAVSDKVDLIRSFRETGRTRMLDTSEGSWETLLDDELVGSLAFSPNGAYIGVGSQDGILHVFKTAKSKDAGVTAKGDARNLKEEILRLRDVGSITTVAFSDDGRYVATASSPAPMLPAGTANNYPLRVWLLRPSELIRESERRLGQVKPPGR